MRRRHNKGFTLVELIVVIGILLLLAALAFPVFSRVKEGANRNTCMSNLHQIGIALSLYRQDYDGKEAEKGVPLSHSQLGLPHWFSAGSFLGGYVKNRQVEFCPSFSGGTHGKGSTYQWGVFDSEYTDPSQNFEAIAALRGPDYPMVICTSHNGPEVPDTMRRSNEIMIYHVLRISGRVDVRKAPADADMHLKTW